MVSSGANPPHQLFGTPGSHTGSTDIRLGEVRHHNSSQDRQHIRGGLHQQNGGDGINYTIASNQGSMVMVYGKEYPVTSTALTRNIEFHCRQGVEELVRQIRMEAFPSLLSKDQSSAGTTLNRPVCKPVVSSAASLYQLETRSTGNSYRCLHGGLVQVSSETLRQSTMESSGQSPISDTQPGGTGISLVVPVWKAQPWYPLLLQMLVREPLLIPQSPETIQSVCHNNLPDISPQLAVWVVSGIDARVATFQNQLQTSFYHLGGSNPPNRTTDARVATFQNQLQTSFYHLGGSNPPNRTTPPSTSGLAGVRNGIEIPFLDLSAM